MAIACASVTGRFSGRLWQRHLRFHLSDVSFWPLPHKLQRSNSLRSQQMSAKIHRQRSCLVMLKVGRNLFIQNCNQFMFWVIEFRMPWLSLILKQKLKPDINKEQISQLSPDIPPTEMAGEISTSNCRNTGSRRCGDYTCCDFHSSIIYLPLIRKLKNNKATS